MEDKNEASEEIERPQGYSVEEVYLKMGGIRIFHWFASLMMIMGYLSG